MRRRQTRAELTADNDRRLAEAARSVFLKRGYHGATLDQVAAAAGLTKGAVYARFASKAELFLSLLEARITERIVEMDALPPPTGARDVDLVFRRWLERSRTDADWSLLVIEFRVAAARDRALNQRYAAAHERLVAAIAARLAHGLRASVSASALEIARVGMALANGMLLERAAGAESVSEETALRANLALYEGLTAQLRTARRSA
jgi:AcrR family transcriptional regulator